MMDARCPRDTEIGSMMETMQESVSDIIDIIHRLQKLPIVHIHDD